MHLGTQLHKQFSLPYQSFDRVKTRYDLMKDGEVKTREVDGVTISGILDDLRVLFNPRTQQKFICLVEMKTTGKPHLWSNEIEKAKFQLQLYLFLYKPLLEKMGYKLHCRHYVEVWSQVNGKLIERVVVYEDPEIEEKIRYIFDSFRGLQPMTYPPQWVCKRCIKAVRDECERFQNGKHYGLFQKVD